MDARKEELNREIQELSESFTAKAELLEKELTEKYDVVRNTLERTLDTVTIAARAVAPKLLIRSHPWIAMGTAVVGGVILARKVVGDVRSQKDVSPPTYMPPPSAYAAHYGAGFAPAYVEPPKAGLMQKYQPEISAVKRMALAALARYAGKKLRQQMPQFSNQLQIAEDSLVGMMQARAAAPTKSPLDA